MSVVETMPDKGIIGLVRMASRRIFSRYSQHNKYDDIRRILIKTSETYLAYIELFLSALVRCLYRTDLR